MKRGEHAHTIRSDIPNQTWRFITHPDHVQTLWNDGTGKVEKTMTLSPLNVYHTSEPCSAWVLCNVDAWCLIGHMGSFCRPSWFCHRDSMGRAPIQSHSWRSGQLLFFLLQWWNSIKLMIIMEDWNWLTPHSLLLWEYCLTETQIEILL